MHRPCAAAIRSARFRRQAVESASPPSQQADSQQQSALPSCPPPQRSLLRSQAQHTQPPHVGALQCSQWSCRSPWRRGRLSECSGERGLVRTASSGGTEGESAGESDDEQRIETAKRTAGNCAQHREQGAVRPRRALGRSPPLRPPRAPPRRHGEERNSGRCGGGVQSAILCDRLRRWVWVVVPHLCVRCTARLRGQHELTLGPKRSQTLRTTTAQQTRTTNEVQLTIGQRHERVVVS